MQCVSAHIGAVEINAKRYITFIGLLWHCLLRWRTYFDKESNRKSPMVEIIWFQSVYLFLFLRAWWLLQICFYMERFLIWVFLIILVINTIYACRNCAVWPRSALCCHSPRLRHLACLIFCTSNLSPVSHYFSLSVIYDYSLLLWIAVFLTLVYQSIKVFNRCLSIQLP